MTEEFITTSAPLLKVRAYLGLKKSRATYIRKPPLILKESLTTLALAICLAGHATADTGFLSDGKGFITWGDTSLGETNGMPTTGLFRSFDTGDFYSVAIRMDGSLVAWGWDTGGVVSTAPTSGSYLAVSAGGASATALRSDGALVSWGPNYFNEVSATPNTGTFRQVSAGFGHGVALRADGSVAAWGLDNQGQVSATPAGVFTAVAAGSDHSLALRSNGTIAAWGSNSAMQVSGVPTGAFTAIDAEGALSLALRTDGTIAAWGESRFGLLTDVPTGSFVAIAAGSGTGHALRADGSIVTWGYDPKEIGSPTGTGFVAVSGGANSSTAMIGRTDYDDLLVGGSGIRVSLNRNVSVAGNATVDSDFTLYNAPTMNVDGELRINAASRISGTGNINAGTLVGNSALTLDNGARLNAYVAKTSRFSGPLTLRSGGSLGLLGQGVFSPASLSIGTGSVVRMAGGQTLLVSGSIGNAGDIDVAGATGLSGESTLETLDTLTNSTGATITARNTRIAARSASNAGTITFTSGVNDFIGDLTNTGALTVTGGASATLHNNVINNGTITVRDQGQTSSSLTILGKLSGAGSFVGDGDLILEGGFSPGNSPASILVDTDLTLGTHASTLLEIGGTTAGLYDQVTVTGDLVLAGSLQVTLLNGYALKLGDSFDVFTVGGSLSGGFSGLADGSTVGVYSGLELKIGYSPSGVKLQAVPEPSTLAALGFGALVLLRRKRRRS